MWYRKRSEDIQVAVRPIYCRADSSPKENLFVWTYDVVISNFGDEPIQLLNRYWKIVDAKQQVQEVHGPGVVGDRPVIAPGEEYTYTSFTHLPTSQGEMSGHYEMVATDGSALNALIPTFPLQLPVRLVEPASAATQDNATSIH